MDSSELDCLKQQDFLRSYSCLPFAIPGLGNLSKTQVRRNINQPHTSTTIVNRLHPTLVYQVNNPSAAFSLLPTDSEDVTMNAVPSSTSHHRYNPIVERKFRRGRSYV